MKIFLPVFMIFCFVAGMSVNRYVCIAVCSKENWPVSGFYGWHGSYCINNYGVPRKNRTHRGVDINLGFCSAADLGAPVFATHDGVVTRVRSITGDRNGGGNRVSITSANGRVSTNYMHLDSIFVRENERITKGVRIGTVGASGFGKRTYYSPHLHYEVIIDGKHVNPIKNGNLLNINGI